LYGRRAVDSGAEVVGTITPKRREAGIDLGDDARVERLAKMRGLRSRPPPPIKKVDRAG
jgi:hypothetical protein